MKMRKEIAYLTAVALILLISLPYAAGESLAEKEDELEKMLRTNQEETRKLEANKDRTLKEEAAFQMLKRDHEILLNGIGDVQRKIEIEKAKANLDYYQKQIDSLEWFIANERDPEKLKQLEMEKKELEGFAGAARESYERVGYQRVDWGAFAGEMFTGFATGRFYDTYYGLAKAGSLLLSKAELEKNARALRTLFCDVLHFPIVECVASKLCRKFPDSIRRDSAIVTRTATNVIESVAHVEGFKSQPIPKPESKTPRTERLYTGTVAVLNNLNTALEFSVELVGRSTYIWINKEKLSPGQGYSKPKTAPLNSYLDEEYDYICLALSPGIRDYRGNTHTRLCSPLVVK